jgi:predicted negative regulator of RcsB-dependent stress response
MKSIYFHVIYLAIIAYLGYNYWSSVQAFKAFLNTKFYPNAAAIASKRPLSKKAVFYLKMSCQRFFTKNGNKSLSLFIKLN